MCYVFFSFNKPVLIGHIQQTKQLELFSQQIQQKTLDYKYKKELLYFNYKSSSIYYKYESNLIDESNGNSKQFPQLLRPLNVTVVNE